MAGKVCANCGSQIERGRFKVASMVTGKRFAVCSARCGYEFGPVLFDREADAYAAVEERRSERQAEFDAGII